MCILCVVQKWSRRVATMLPWLVLPLIGLWALSQLLPPGFRFEVTSPRLACVLVLLVTLFWYEILMPQLSAWRVRRSARLRERKRFEAIEMQKLRKTAIRRCRNCLNPYRDQNPAGGKFMCSYCGHASKRPVLDLPGLGLTRSGLIGDLVGKSGRMWNGKVWSENGWSCGPDWLENGNWVGGSFSGNVNYWEKGGGFFGGDDRCLAEKSYSGVVMITCKLLTSSFFIIRWLWRRIFRISTARGNASLDGEHKGMLPKNGENGGNFHESRGDKARRRAEEKKQAKLEKELLEEEERKQREEVARLVEERRRQRDEKMEAEKERSKGSTPDREKDGKRESEKKSQERRKEKDKGSSKSNSDGEELEKRVGKESEKKREFDKRTDVERREAQKNTSESFRTQSLETAHGVRVTNTNNFSKGGGGSRYLDREKGSFLSSSKGFNGSSFFGKGGHAAVTVVPKNNSNGSMDHVQATGNRREVHLNEHPAGKINLNGDDKVTDVSFQRPVVSEPQPWAAPKKSWQQLFTHSSAVPPPSNVNTISRPNHKPQADVRSSYLPGQAPPLHPLDNPIQFGVSLPYNLSPYPSCSISSGFVSSATEPNFPLVGEPAHEYVPQEPELFEDPCYVPDPVSLLGPVSESLDIFPLDLGSGFVADTGFERPWSLQNASVSAEINRPSPIESPMSRVRVAEERQNTSNQFPYTPKAHDLHTSPTDVSNNINEQGTWQMWGTPPLVQDGLGLVSGSASWVLPLGQNKSNQEEAMLPSSHKAMMSPFATDDNALPGSFSPRKVHLGSCQNGGMFNPLGPGLNNNGVWLPKAVCQSLSVDGENHIPPHNPHDDISRNEMTYGSPSKFGTGLPFEPSPANCWSKKDWDVHGSRENFGNSTPARPVIGGLFSRPDVQSLWSFN